jgi:hypothetical protein
MEDGADVQGSAFEALSIASGERLSQLSAKSRARSRQAYYGTQSGLGSKLGVKPPCKISSGS